MPHVFFFCDSLLEDILVNGLVDFVALPVPDRSRIWSRMMDAGSVHLAPDSISSVYSGAREVWIHQALIFVF